MKKLMFIAAIVCALGAQAASLDWSITAKSFTDQAGGKQFSKTVYLLDTNASDYSALTAALAGGTLDGGISGFKASDWSAVIGSATTYTSSKTASMTKNYSKTSGTATVDTVKVYDVAYLVFDSQSSKDYYMLSSTTTGLSYESSPDDGDPVSFATAMAGTWTEYTGGTPGVPEPTSGLLLVLGGAMLALRRKQK